MNLLCAWYCGGGINTITELLIFMASHSPSVFKNGVPPHVYSSPVDYRGLTRDSLWISEESPCFLLGWLKMNSWRTVIWNGFSGISRTLVRGNAQRSGTSGERGWQVSRRFQQYSFRRRSPWSKMRGVVWSRPVEILEWKTEFALGKVLGREALVSFLFLTFPVLIGLPLFCWWA